MNLIFFSEWGDSRKGILVFCFSFGAVVGGAILICIVTIICIRGNINLTKMFYSMCRYTNIKKEYSTGCYIQHWKIVLVTLFSWLIMIVLNITKPKTNIRTYTKLHSCFDITWQIACHWVFCEEGYNETGEGRNELYFDKFLFNTTKVFIYLCVYNLLKFSWYSTLNVMNMNTFFYMRNTRTRVSIFFFFLNKICI